MSLVIGLWALTALAVVVGRARRGSWKTVRRYQAGQRALARLGPKEPAPDDDSEHTPAGAGVDDDPLPHVRLLEGDHLPPPRPASYAGQRPIGSWRPGWVRTADDFDGRPSVSIDTRTWSHEPADPVPEAEPRPALAVAARRSRPLHAVQVATPRHGRAGRRSGPIAVTAAAAVARAQTVAPDPVLAPARITSRSTHPDPLTMASFIKVAGAHSRRPRWVQPAHHGPRPAKALLGAAAAVLALLATTAAATMHSRPTEASVSARRAATTHPAPPSTVVASHAATSLSPGTAPPVQVAGDASTATVATSSGSMVQLTAAGPCWFEVRAGSSGPVIAESTLAAGQTTSVPLQDGLWMRLGDPAAVTLSIDGRVLALPSQAGQPMDVTFSRRSG